ncbi:hypothetical protein OH77DRAFT_1183076 [Trametes cingulata]|nr:hypothetical protein OH77DRAFT_1183076 [Trametes cingulata]
MGCPPSVHPEATCKPTPDVRSPRPSPVSPPPAVSSVRPDRTSASERRSQTSSRPLQLSATTSQLKLPTVAAAGWTKASAVVNDVNAPSWTDRRRAYAVLLTAARPRAVTTIACSSEIDSVSTPAGSRSRAMLPPPLANLLYDWQSLFVPSAAEYSCQQTSVAHSCSSHILRGRATGPRCSSSPRSKTSRKGVEGTLSVSSRP